MKTTYKLLNAFILCSVVIGSCTRPVDTSMEEAVSVKPEPVRVMLLQYNEVSRSEDLTAEIKAFEETNLAPALSGRINRISVDINDRVNAGQILVEMDRTQLEQTRVQYQTLMKDLTRMDTLLQYGSVTQQAYDQQKTAVEMQEVLLKNLEKNTLLKAPYDGIITGRYYNEGELFSPAPNTPSGKAAILTLMQLNMVKVNVSIPEKHLPSVHPGLTASIETDVYTGARFEGKTSRVYPIIDPMTRTFQAEIIVQNPGIKLRPGMFAKVYLELGERKAMTVPAIAVLQQPGTNDRFVYIHRDGKAHKVMVKQGERFDDKLEILSDVLKPGDELIYAGQNRLEDMSVVEVVR